MLTSISRIQSNLKDCPDKLETIDEEDQINWKKSIIKIVNSKLEDMFNIQVKKASKDKSNKNYNKYLLIYCNLTEE